MNGDGGYRAWAATELTTRGLEALVEGVAQGVSKKVWLLPGSRERGVAILRGCPADRLHASRPYRVVPPGTSPAGRALVAAGIAMAGEPALAFLGTGSTAYGEFHAALHLIAAHKLPVQLVVSWYEGDGPFAAPLAVDPARLAEALGLRATRVDGTDVAAVRGAVESGATVILAVLRGKA